MTSKNKILLRLGVALLTAIPLASSAETLNWVTFPESFPSAEKAKAYAAQSLPIGGGDVAFVKVHDTNIMVMIAHGSGVPEIAIACYKMVDRNWQLQTQIAPPSIGEFHKAVVSGDEVRLVGEKSKKTWPLLKVK